MKRFSLAYSGLALTLTVVGCGGGSGVKVDLGKADLTVIPMGGDMAVAPEEDMAVTQGGSAVTGDPCTKNADCKNGNGTNQKATCIKVTGQPPNQIMWDKGYCSTPCRTIKTDPMTGLNTDCPSDNATCSDGGSGTGECRNACQLSSDCRDLYACFVVGRTLGCLPKSISECSPQSPGTCYAPPKMKKCMPAKPDGGMAPICFEETCVNVGDGTVGTCVPGCSPFEPNVMKNGCPGGMDGEDCHASDVTGEGLCVNPGQGMPGGACANFYSDCPNGYGCGRADRKCWKYCNTANAKTQCAMGATCVKYTKMVNGKAVDVDAAGTGICSKSL